jgi:hypothetical protein
MTNPDHVHFAEWDAAYVLGALSPADRREFEDHLEECERCRAAVAELSALPGLLGRLDDARAFALLEHPDDETVSSAPADLVARIRERDRTQRVRRTLLSVAGLAAAAVLASVLTLAVPALVTTAPVPQAHSAFVPVAGTTIPVDVTLDLFPAEWGTRIKMDCVYHPAGAGADGPYGPVVYSLWVVGTDGSEHSVSTWNATPGGEVFLDAATADSLGDIEQFDLRSADGDTVFMTGDVTYPE